GTTLKFAGFPTPAYLRLAATHFVHPALGVNLEVSEDVFGISGDGFRDFVTGVEHSFSIAGGVVARARPLDSLSVEGRAGYEYAVAAASTSRSRDYILVQRSHRLGLTVRTWLVPAGADMKGLDRSLPSGPGRIHGLVVRESNAPIPGAKVEVPGKDPVLTGED